MNEYGSYQVFKRPAESVQPVQPIEQSTLLGSDVLTNSPPPLPTLQKGNWRIVLQEKNGRDQIVITDSIMSRGVLLSGSPGTGKSTVMEQMAGQTLAQLTPQDVCILFDAKGDYARSFFDPQNPCHVLIGNSPQFRHVTRKWNIFAEIAPLDELMMEENAAVHEQMAAEIARLLYDEQRNTSQPFFPLAAADITAKILIDLLRRARVHNRRDLLCNRQVAKAIREACPETFAAMLRRNPDFVSIRNYLGLSSGDEAFNEPMNDQGLGVYGTMIAMANSVFTGVFGEGGPEDQFSLRGAVRDGDSVVFIEYDMSTGESLAPVYKLIFTSAIMEALSRSQRYGNTYLFLDELKLLAPCRLDDALNFGRCLRSMQLPDGQTRDFGVRLVAGLQNIHQLQPTYSEQQAMSLLAGFGTVISFASRDAATREWVSQRMGKGYQSVCYQPTRNDKPLYIQREGYAVEDWVLRSLETGQAVVEICGSNPFRFSFAR